MRRLLLTCLLAALAAGCGGSESSAPLSAGTTATQGEGTDSVPTTTATSETIALQVYFLRGKQVAPVRRDVPHTPAVAGAALAALLAGPTAAERARALTTALPANLELGPPAREEAETLDLGASPDLSPEQAAQIVYTMTQFASVHRVRLGALVFRRSDFEDQTPPILVESPLPDETVSSPVRLRGTANTFEATFQTELLDSAGKKVAGHFVMATSGSGERGTFDATVAAPSASGRVTLVVYEDSAENGQRIHEVRIPLVIG
jgi:germination protein M